MVSGKIRIKTAKTEEQIEQRKQERCCLLTLQSLGKMLVSISLERKIICDLTLAGVGLIDLCSFIKHMR